MPGSPVSTPPVRSERAIQLLAFTWFFCLLAVNFVLRPIREAIGVVGTVDRLSWLYTGTFVATLLANPVYGVVVARYRRRSFVPGVYVFFAANLVLFCVAFATSEAGARQAAHNVFFVWLSVFNVCAVTTFWGLLVDVFDRATATRRFGVIGAGGTLGGIAGSQLATHGSAWLGYVGLMVAATLLLLLAATFAFFVLRNAGDTPETERPLAGNPLQGWRDVTTNRYLLTIAAYVLLFTVPPTFIYFERAELVAAAIGTDAGRVSHYANVDTWSNALTLVAQLVGTAPLLVGLGVGRCLAFVPVLCTFGFAAVAAAPTVALLALFEVARRGVHFVTSKPAQEVLFTIVERDQKYKAKSFIDTVVYRGGDVLAAWCYVGAAAAVGGGATAWLASGVSLGWIALALKLGRMHERAALRKPAAACGHTMPS